MGFYESALGNEVRPIQFILRDLPLERQTRYPYHRSAVDLLQSMSYMI